MDKSYIINWLTRRNNLAKSNKLLAFDHEDIVFFRNYIHHYTGTLVEQQDIIQSIVNRHPQMMVAYLDNMCTKLVNDFKIDIKTSKRVVQDPAFNLFTFGTPFHTEEIEFIEEY